MTNLLINDTTCYISQRGDRYVVQTLKTPANITQNALIMLISIMQMSSFAYKLYITIYIQFLSFIWDILG